MQSILGQCPDCCNSPSVSIEWDARNATAPRYGFRGFDPIAPKVYLTRTWSGTGNFTGYSSSPCSGPVTSTSSRNYYGAVNTNLLTGDRSGQHCIDFIGTSSSSTQCYFFGESLVNVITYGDVVVVSDSQRRGSAGCSGTLGFDQFNVRETLSNEHTMEQVRATLEQKLANVGWDGDYGDLAGAQYLITYSSVETFFDENSNFYPAGAVGREARYRFRAYFPQPINPAPVRISWVERFLAMRKDPTINHEVIPMPLNGLTLVKSGVCRPSVSWEGDGQDLELIAIMEPDGSVSRIEILNPGNGFTSPPDITVEESQGGATSTGWVAEISDSGEVTSVTGGSGGDYLPAILIARDGSNAGATEATATCTMTPQGGLATVTLQSPGSGYVGRPNVAVYPRVPFGVLPEIFANLGVETPRCVVWVGEIPENGEVVIEGGEFLLPVQMGKFEVDNVIVSFNQSPCP